MTKYLMTEKGYHIVDITGERFGEWMVVGYSHHTKDNKQYWLCRCKCGFEKPQEVYSLRTGRTRMCRKCSAAIVGGGLATHGGSGSHLYKTWQAIKQRCYNPRQAKGYRYHGALGVTMCEAWRSSFEAFAAAVGERPSALHSLDRFPNPDGNYEPGNVRWATPAEQGANRRDGMSRAEFNRRRHCLHRLDSGS